MKRHKKQGRFVSIEQLEGRVVFSASSLNPILESPISQYSITGAGNNVADPTWGSDGVELLRMAAAQYGDGISTPAGASRPSARTISNTLSDQGSEDVISDRYLSAFAYVWGQFIDHDLDLTNTATPAEPFDIDVPEGDAYFNPDGTIPLNRSAYDPGTGTNDARQQVNSITAWLDGSMIYGATAATAAALRTFTGGLMKTSDGGLLPLNNSATLPGGTLDMANDSHLVPSDQLFAAGDVRANENTELTALQTLFVREHNYWARQISAADGTLSDEQVYQRARAIVIGELQAITYNQWLPALLGKDAMAPYQGYDPSVNPGIANEFSTAAFRLGHSMLGDDVEFLDNQGLPVADEASLSETFFNPQFVQELGIDSVLKYLASDPSSEIDLKVVGSLRNFLFGPPGSGGLDLASMNIQRGRDHGLADYNSVRAAYGLPKVTSFSEITSDPEVQAKLEDLYGSVDNIDLWVGGLAEDHVKGSSVGPTFRAIIADQFERLRDGDRFWYQNVFSGALRKQIDNTSLADILRRNTGLTNLQGNVFFFRASISGVISVQTNRHDSRAGQPSQPPSAQLKQLTVELVDQESGEVVASTHVNKRGHYRFDVSDGLGTGEYRIRVVPPASSDAPTITSRTIAITRGSQRVDGINFVLHAPKSDSPASPRQKPPQAPLGRPTAAAVDSAMAVGVCSQLSSQPDGSRAADEQMPMARNVDRVMESESSNSRTESTAASFRPPMPAQVAGRDDRTLAAPGAPARGGPAEANRATLARLR